MTPHDDILFETSLESNSIFRFWVSSLPRTTDNRGAAFDDFYQNGFF